MTLFILIQFFNYVCLTYLGLKIDEQKDKIKPFIILFIGWFIFMNPITLGLVLYG